MKLVVNGEEIVVADDTTVSRLLALHNVKMPEMVSVELNGQILERGTFADTELQEGDQLEFMYFMGGGGFAPSAAGGVS
jgi:sulfur carrier protein